MLPGGEIPEFVSPYIGALLEKDTKQGTSSQATVY